jgi:Glycosyltransferase like family
MRFAFYFATREVHAEKTPAYKSLTKIKKVLPNIDLFYDTNNSIGLSVNYNNFLYTHKNSYDYLIFLHDDVFVDDLNVCNKLIEAHKTFDIVGLAGGLNPKIQEPALWHLMCGGFGSGNLRGAVAHPASPDSIAMTSFGITPCRVAVLDGLFLSICTTSIKKAEWKFNENYDFHHYDIASCIDANKKKLKLGVAPIWVIHSSPGLMNINDKRFTDSQAKFTSEYSKLVV